MQFQFYCGYAILTNQSDNESTSSVSGHPPWNRVIEFLPPRLSPFSCRTKLLELCGIPIESMRLAGQINTRGLRLVHFINELNFIDRVQPTGFGISLEDLQSDNESQPFRNKVTWLTLVRLVWSLLHSKFKIFIFRLIHLVIFVSLFNLVIFKFSVKLSKLT